MSYPPDGFDRLHLAYARTNSDNLSVRIALILYHIPVLFSSTYEQLFQQIFDFISSTLCTYCTIIKANEYSILADKLDIGAFYDDILVTTHNPEGSWLAIDDKGDDIRPCSIHFDIVHIADL